MAAEPQALAPLGGRRFTLTIAASAVYTALLVFGYLNQETYSALQMMTVGAYLAAASVQKWSQERYSPKESERAGHPGNE